MSKQAGSHVFFICPDYVSHFFPLSALAEECARRGMVVTIGTGPGLKARVEALGFAYVELVLGPGSNTGVMRTEEQPSAEGDHMREFFDATRGGPVRTLLYQSRAREHDMLWRPEAVYERLAHLARDIKPNYIVVDQLAFGATLALHAMQIPFASFLPANPSSLPGPGEYFGLPARLPAAFTPSPADWSELKRACAETELAFTRRFNEVLTRLAPDVPHVQSAFRFTSPWLVLLNYPLELGAHRLNALPPAAQFIGSSVRNERVDEEFESAVRRLQSTRPTVYVSLGTFLSAREDVLTTITGALRRLDVQCVVATGSAGSHVVDGIPDDWITRPVIPQIAALRRSDLVISHGGNNTLTEALALAVPMLVAPFSSDQFDSAADIETAALGGVFDPNHTDEAQLAGQIERLLEDEPLRRRSASMAGRLQALPGPALAVDLLTSASLSSRIGIPAHAASSRSSR